MFLLSRPGLGDLVKKELKGKNFLNIEPHSEKLRIQFKPFHTVSLYLEKWKKNRHSKVSLVATAPIKLKMVKELIIRHKLYFIFANWWGEPVLFQIILFTSVLSLKFQRFTSCKCNFNWTSMHIWQCLLLKLCLLKFKLISFLLFKLFFHFHSSMPSPLAPDPIRVQPCVLCLFWTIRNCMVVTSIFLSSSLST